MGWNGEGCGKNWERKRENTNNETHGCTPPIYRIIKIKERKRGFVLSMTAVLFSSYNIVRYTFLDNDSTKSFTIRIAQTTRSNPEQTLLNNIYKHFPIERETLHYLIFDTHKTYKPTVIRKQDLDCHYRPNLFD